MSHTLTIGNRVIGEGHPTFIIAEIGINHNGDVALAKRLVDAAVDAGVDAVKFQKRDLPEIYSRKLLDQPRHGEQGVQYLLPLLKEFELTPEAMREVQAYCRQRGVLFLCTAFDARSVDFLEQLGVVAYKIGSPDMSNFPLIEYIHGTGKPMLLSTGMAAEEEIRRTLAFLNDRKINAGLFHCVSTYPVAADEVNLRFMQTLREWSGERPVGYSGHETGIAISTAAVALGACMIERHITLDRNMRGPDHMASLEPADFIRLVKAVREVEQALGAPHRWLTRGEVLNRRTLAKSLVATRDLVEGAEVTADAVTCRSPGLGLSPQSLDQLMGRTLRRSVRRDEPFLEEDLLDAVTEIGFTRPIDVGLTWGVIVRFMDLKSLVPRFAEAGMGLIEFHVSDRDLDAGLGEFPEDSYPHDLVVHAPEYSYDELIDLCSKDEAQRSHSVVRIQKTIDLAREIGKRFTRMTPKGPKVIIHVGGMAEQADGYDLEGAFARMLASLKALDHSGVDLLLENLPPYPWYFGGRWYGFVMTDAETVARACRESGLGLCFDTSHAALECHRAGVSLRDYARCVLPHIHHLHISDGAGVSGEGLQIGEGQISFLEVMPLLMGTGVTCVPEIWMGHHRNGAGFRIALERLSEIAWACRVLARAETPSVQSALHHMVVPPTETIRFALETIDRNRMGIVFVVDALGCVAGVVTDGDIRRGLLNGKTLQSLISEVMVQDFFYVLDDVDPVEAKKYLSSRYRVIPVLDSGRRLVTYHSLSSPVVE